MKKLISTAAAALASVSVAVAMPLAAGAANSTTVVTPQNMNGWRFMDDQNDTEVGATGHMVTGPTNPPLGVGSAELETTSPTDGQALLKNAYGGKKLSAFTGLSY